MINPPLILAIFLGACITGCSTQESPKTSQPPSPAPPLSNSANASATPTITNTSEPSRGNPEDEIALAQVMAQQNRTEDATLHYREAIRLYREQLRRQPDSPEALNHLAWLLATNPNADIRDGKEALDLAQRACALTKNQNPAFQITLASAFAETGQFSEALKTARQARQQALAVNDKSTAAQAAEFLKLFQSRQPYHEPF